MIKPRRCYLHDEIKSDTEFGILYNREYYWGTIWKAIDGNTFKKWETVDGAFRLNKEEVTYKKYGDVWLEVRKKKNGS